MVTLGLAQLVTSWRVTVRDGHGDIGDSTGTEAPPPVPCRWPAAR